MSQGRAEPPRRRRGSAGPGARGDQPGAESATPEQAVAGPETPGANASDSPGESGAARPRPRRRRGRGGRKRAAAGRTDAARDPSGANDGPGTTGTRTPGPRAQPSGKAGAAGGKSASTSKSASTGNSARARSGSSRAKTKSAGKGGGAAKATSTPKGGAAGRSDRRAKRTWMRRVDEFSAGGLVLDLAGDVPRGALIGRTDKLGRLLWSLPKGHIEEGETAEQAAVREVAEETGISGVIVGELGTIDFWFVAEGRRIHKTVRHFLMRAVGGELSDADIEVTAVAWVALPDIGDQLAYPDERGLVETAGRLLAESA